MAADNRSRGASAPRRCPPCVSLSSPIRNRGESDLTSYRRAADFLNVNRIRQVRRERRDAAMAGQVIPERRQSPDVISARHAFRRAAVAVTGTAGDRSAQLRDAFQRRAPQCLGVLHNVALSLALEARHPAVERGDELTQVMDKRLV
jgi:hypothetical protein